MSLNPKAGSRTPLAERKCIPCTGATKRLEGQPLEDLLQQTPEWNAVAGHHLHRLYKFPDFKSALDFVNRVGAIAEEAGHHPDISFTWGKVEITIFTHAINGLSESDFVLAAKINTLK